MEVATREHFARSAGKFKQRLFSAVIGNQRQDRHRYLSLRASTGRKHDLILSSSLAISFL